MSYSTHRFSFRCGRCNKSVEYEDSGGFFGGYCPQCAFNYCSDCASSQKCPSHRADYLQKPKRGAESPVQRRNRRFKVAVFVAVLISVCWVPYIRWIAIFALAAIVLILAGMGITIIMGKFRKPKKRVKMEFGDLEVQHGLDAAFLAEQEGWLRSLPASGYIASVRSKADRRNLDMIVDMTIKCGKHSTKNPYHTSVSSEMSRHMAHFKLECGCMVQLEMGGGPSGKVFFARAIGVVHEAQLRITKVMEE